MALRSAAVVAICAAVVACSLSCVAASPPSDPLQPPFVWQTFEFTQTLDHFDFYNSTATFQQRYLVNDTWYRPGGPIFFYTGNEGPIELFADNTGFMWDIAPQFQALLVFAEHRYYGSSLPFGNLTFKDKHANRLSFLTSEQALADYATLLPVVKQAYKATDAPVISFGGSYGGMLSAWFRIKYPWMVDGSIAASAPVLQFTGLTGPEAYNHVITNTFRNASVACAEGVYKSWDLIKALSVADMNRIFTPCTPITSQEEYMTIFNWLNGAIAYMTMADYPYPTSFLGPLPGWPVNQACKFFDNNDPVTAMRMLGNMFFNYTGQEGSCFDLNQAGPATLHGLGGWAYQACTEMIMPVGQYGPPNDMFWIAPWSLNAALESCEAQYGITPRPTWVQTSYGGKDLNGASNIVFSNGDLDPWSSGGVHFNVSQNGIWAITIKDGAHHLDLRAANPADPHSVKVAREFEVANIQKWIDMHNKRQAAEL